jgi:hypothetical protein
MVFSRKGSEEDEKCTKICRAFKFMVPGIINNVFLRDNVFGFDGTRGVWL